MATLSAAISIPGASRVNSCDVQLTKLNSFKHPSRLTFQRKSDRLRPNLSVRAQNKDGSKGGGDGDFFAGFLLGGAVFGTLAYIYSPQIRRFILNEDEHGFRKARRPMYYDAYHDDGLEKARLILNAKIRQLNSVIDNVSSRLRGWNKAREDVEIDSEIEATM